MGSHKITGLLNPESNQDAATKKYVDDKVAVEGDDGGDGGVLMMVLVMVR